MDVKDETRVLGFQDGPFSFGDETCQLAGVLARGGGYVEGVLVDEVTVDGRDATDTIVDLVAPTGFADTAQALAFEGGTVGGFNVLDLDRLHEALGLPVIALTREEPDPASVRAALERHVDDAEDRARLLQAHPVHAVELDEAPVYLRHAGGDTRRLAQLVRVHTVRGRVPEPLRIARLVARAVARGRST
jgi:endonuclease V-like protein UPF0215 family